MPNNLPTQLMQYQLLPFCNIKAAVKVAQASQQMFTTLRHNIKRTDSITSDTYIQQQSKLMGSKTMGSKPMGSTNIINSKHIGVCSSVTLTTLQQLTNLIQHLQEAQHNDKSASVSKTTSKTASNLHTLTFGYEFNQALDKVILPPTSHTLTFGYDFNQALDQVKLPPQLHTLTFGEEFNQALNRVPLPPTLHTLTFGWNFNQSLDQVKLPPHLHTLTFGFYFNQTLDNVTLPPNLHTLIFGYDFNQALGNVTLPPNLHTLTFGYYFSQSLLHLVMPLPSQLLVSNHLVIRKKGKKMPSNLLPPGLNIQYI